MDTSLKTKECFQLSYQQFNALEFKFDRHTCTFNLFTSILSYKLSSYLIQKVEHVNLSCCSSCFVLQIKMYLASVEGNLKLQISSIC